MKKLLGGIDNRQGIVTVIMLLFLLGVGILTINTMLNSQMNQSSSNNYKYKIQTFYAADGLMTLLAQDMIDTNENTYLVDRMSHKDIGGPSKAGSYSYDKIRNIDTIKGAGIDIWDHSDQFHYLYTRVKGDIDISVKVVSMTNTDPWAKGGIMIREKLIGTSKHAMICRIYNSSTGVRLQYRASEGDISVDNLTASTDAQWIRIKRTGNSFKAYRSSNGSSWVFVSSQTVSMSDSVYAGLVVTSHNPSVLCTGIFSNLQGLTRRSCIDSTFVGAGSDIPVKYTINETGAGIFSMNTEGYKVKGSLKVPNYVSSLNQTISRARIEDWYSPATDSAFIPVTFYDMRSDGSNPEFNVEAFVHKPCPPCTSPGTGYFYPHLIELNNLTSDRKPIKYSPSATFRTNFMSIWSPSWYSLNAWDRSVTYCYNATPAKLSTVFTNDESKFTWCFNDSMNTWFRPYGDSAGKSGTYTYDYLKCRWSGLKVRPTWIYAPGHDTEWVSQHWDSTNHFANIVIYDTLKFIEDPANRGVFSFGKDKSDPRWFVSCKDCDFTGNCKVWDPKFMPLWYQGFGYDCVFRYWMGAGADTMCFVKQNFSFTMEMHRNFTYKSGQIFEFTGDDDVWVFINNRCVIDLGGIHEAAYKKVILDTLGLTVGQEYLFDFFYCERDVTTSNILITTNMLLFTPPQTSKRNWKRDYGNID